uniref:Photosystem II reaction center protein Psb30 n=1 Tax=Euglenaformis proxima TaxID=299110 RepID=A0A023HI03_9EUGL|nr:photosystem II reaction center protein [Euglenaformis proxima]AGL11979.1 photosystem II reaction center protein [Euglenaformis proxima]
MNTEVISQLSALLLIVLAGPAIIAIIFVRQGNL